MSMKMTMAEFVGLEPCPFCGGEAFVNDDPTGNGGKPHMSGNVGLGRLWSVECDECGADAGFWQDRDVAIAAWNSRAERTCKMQPSPFTDWAGLNMRIVAGWYCENCGECCLTETTIDDDHPTPNYCPNCGAKVVDE